MSDTGVGNTYQRGNTWWISYYHRGKRHRESSGSHRKGDAARLLKQRLGEIGQGRLIGRSEDAVTFEDLASIVVTFYKSNGHASTARLLTSLTHLRRYLGDYHAVEITPLVLRRYKLDRQDEGAAPASIRKEFAALRKAFKEAVELEELSSIPTFPTVTVNNTREGFVDRSMLEAVCQHLGPTEAAITRFAYLTGWRQGKILPLRWVQVDWETGTVRPAVGAANKPVGKPFPFRKFGELHELMKQQRESADQLGREGHIVPWVFHRDGEPIKWFFGRQWNSACIKAGLWEWKTDKTTGAPIKTHTVVFHDLKRSAVRNFERAGTSRSVGMKLTGHKTESIYRRYAIADTVALEEGVTKLDELNELDRVGTIQSQAARISDILERTGT